MYKPRNQFRVLLSCTMLAVSVSCIGALVSAESRTLLEEWRPPPLRDTQKELQLSQQLEKVAIPANTLTVRVTSYTYRDKVIRGKPQQNQTTIDDDLLTQRSVPADSFGLS